jgi:IS5 family transposase
MCFKIKYLWMGIKQWYRMSDPAMEDALYEIAPMRLFAGLSLDSRYRITLLSSNFVICWASWLGQKDLF